MSNINQPVIINPAKNGKRPSPEAETSPDNCAKFRKDGGEPSVSAVGLGSLPTRSSSARCQSPETRGPMPLRSARTKPCPLETVGVSVPNGSSLVRFKKIIPIVASVGAADVQCMELCDVRGHREFSVPTSYLEAFLRSTDLLKFHNILSWNMARFHTEFLSISCTRIFPNRPSIDTYTTEINDGRYLSPFFLQDLDRWPFFSKWFSRYLCMQLSFNGCM